MPDTDAIAPNEVVFCGVTYIPKTNALSADLQVGEKVLIRTVTHYHTGRVVGVGAQFVLLEDAAWITDTGRFHNALAKGTSILNEIEPFPDGCRVAIGAIVDIAPWPHELPRIQK